jgi:hypothetical protein
VSTTQKCSGMQGCMTARTPTSNFPKTPVPRRAPLPNPFDGLLLTCIVVALITRALRRPQSACTNPYHEETNQSERRSSPGAMSLVVGCGSFGVYHSKPHHLELRELRSPPCTTEGQQLSAGLTVGREIKALLVTSQSGDLAGLSSKQVF